MAFVHPASDELLEWCFRFFFDIERRISWLRRIAVVVVAGCVAEKILKCVAILLYQPTEKVQVGVWVHRRVFLQGR